MPAASNAFSDDTDRRAHAPLFQRHRLEAAADRQREIAPFAKMAARIQRRLAKRLSVPAHGARQRAELQVVEQLQVAAGFFAFQIADELPEAVDA